MTARNDYPILAEVANNPGLLCWTEAAQALDKLDALGLRNRSLAQSRARLTRAAQRLVDACIDDDDHPAEYLAALDAMTELLKHP